MESLFYKLTPKGLRYLEGDYTLESKADGGSPTILEMIRDLGYPNNSGAGWQALFSDYLDSEFESVSKFDIEDEVLEDLRLHIGTLENEGLIETLRSRGPDEPLEADDDYFGR